MCADACRVSGEPVWDSQGLEWTGDQVALHEVAADTLHQIVVGGPLDALSNDFQPERMRHPHDALNAAEGACFLLRGFHKTVVQLHDVDR